MRIRYDLNGTAWIPRPNEALEEALDRQWERLPGQLRWKVGSQPNPVVEFLKTVTSGLVDAATLERRKQSCLQCPALIENKKGLFCGGCKCGSWPLAKLDGSTLPKLGWKGLRCPLGRPGFHGSAVE